MQRPRRDTDMWAALPFDRTAGPTHVQIATVVHTPGPTGSSAPSGSSSSTRGPSRYRWTRRRRASRCTTTRRRTGRPGGAAGRAAGRQRRPPWSLDLVLASIDEALDLARLRGVTMAELPGVAVRAAGAVPPVRRHRERAVDRLRPPGRPPGPPSSCWGRTDASASIVTWPRLEPVDQSSDLSVSLAAPIADPLWLLHRQWQLGELDGNDAGTPVEVRIEHRAVPLSRLRPGDAAAADYSPPQLPLEPVVEAERVRGLTGRHRRLAAETGAQLMRMLTAAELEAVVAALRDGPSPAARRARPDRRSARRRGRGAALRPGRRRRRRRRGAGAARRGTEGERVPPSFPGDTPSCGRWSSAGWRGTTTFSSSRRRAATSAAPTAWDPRRLEHRFATAAGGVADRVTFVARRSTTATSTGPTSTSTRRRISAWPARRSRR